MNVSEDTVITGYNGKRSKLAAALHDKNLHRNYKWTYWGPRVSRGSVEILVNKQWRKIKFYEKDGWCRTIDFLPDEE